MRLTPISPIHCGPGEEFDWTTCILDKANGQAVEFDKSATWISPLTAAKRLADIGESALKPGVDPVPFIQNVQQFFKKEIGAIRRAQGVSHAILPKILNRLDELTGGARVDRMAVQSFEIALAAADPRTGYPIVFVERLKWRAASTS